MIKFIPKNRSKVKRNLNLQTFLRKNIKILFLVIATRLSQEDKLPFLNNQKLQGLNTDHSLKDQPAQHLACWVTLLKNLLVIIQEHKHKEDNNFNKITHLLTKINKIIIKVMFLFNKEIVNHVTNIQLSETLNLMRIGLHCLI